jgi:hypothetical protein
MAVMVVGVPWGDFLGKEKRILRLEELWGGAENLLVPFYRAVGAGEERD